MQIRFLGSSNALSPSRQQIQITAISLLGAAYLALEASGVLNMTARLTIGAIATCMVVTLLGGDGENDPEQRPRLT